MKCAKCGMSATIYNKSGVPVCAKHKNENVKSPDCPDCGSMMQIRNGKFGAFWGCSMYPNCMGIKKV